MVQTPYAFWSLDARALRCGVDQWVHPQDRDDVAALFNYHQPYLHTVPAPFFGPLKTARLVLLYAGPGNTTTGEENDDTQGGDRAWVRRRLASFNGATPIDWDLIQHRARSWFKGRLANILGTPVAQLDAIKNLASKVAFANLTAYRGGRTKWDEVALLPSTSIMRNWAKQSLFRDARDSKRVVLVMRANTWWGLPSGPWVKGHLFAPETNRSGYLARECETAQAAMNAARQAVNLQ